MIIIETLIKLLDFSYICIHRSHSAKNHKKVKNIDLWQKIIKLAKKTASWHKIAKNIHC